MAQANHLVGSSPQVNKVHRGSGHADSKQKPLLVDKGRVLLIHPATEPWRPNVGALVGIRQDSVWTESVFHPEVGAVTGIRKCLPNL